MRKTPARIRFDFSALKTDAQKLRDAESAKYADFIKQPESYKKSLILLSSVYKQFFFLQHFQRLLCLLLKTEKQTEEGEYHGC